MEKEENFELNWDELNPDSLKGEAATEDAAEQPDEYPEEESEEWISEEAPQRGGLFSKVISPVSDSFESLNEKQKGSYILIVGVVAIVVGIVLVIRLIVMNV